MEPKKEKEMKELELKQIKKKVRFFVGKLPTVSSVIKSLTDLTVSGIDDEPEFNESNMPTFEEFLLEPYISALKKAERKTVPDPAEFLLPLNKRKIDPPTYIQHKKLNPTPPRKYQTPVIYSPDNEEENESTILDSSTSFESFLRSTSLKEYAKENLSCKGNSPKGKIFSNLLKGKSKLKRQNISSSGVTRQPLPKIVIQTPDCPISHETFPNKKDEFFNILDLPSTSKQMFIPFDEAQKLATTIRKKISPFNTPDTSPIKRSPNFKKQEIGKNVAKNLDAVTTNTRKLHSRKYPKEFINRYNRNKKRALRKQVKVIKQNIDRFGRRLLKIGNDWLKK